MRGDAAASVAGSLTVGALAGSDGFAQVLGGGTLTVGELSLGGNAGVAGGTGGLTLRDGGTLILDGDGTVFAGGKLTLAGGRFVNDGGLTVDTGVFDTAGGGTLAGDGNFNAAVVAGDGLRLDPGAAGEVGSLAFEELVVGAATYVWDVAEIPGGDDAVGGDWDRLFVDLVDFTATATDPFTVLVRAASVTGFDPTRAYTWELADAAETIGDWDPDAIAFDLSQFGPDAAGGSFFATVDDGQLLANFAPAAVPEPGTWGLILLAAGAGGAARRRKR